MQITDMRGSSKLIYGDLTYQLNGIFFTVHNELGRYRNEQQYGDAIEQHLKHFSIPYQREIVLPQSFVGERNGRSKADFLIADKLIVEVKAKRILEKTDYFQTQRYLAACGKKLAILVNFREKFLKPKRILNASARE